MKKKIIDLLNSYNISFKKHFGQNFFLDLSGLDKLLNKIIPKSENVLEIGPGLGSLTEALTKHYQNVLAVEIDLDYQNFLSTTFPTVKFIFKDFLAVEENELGFNVEFDVIANIPYYLTTEIIIKLLTFKQVNNIVLLTQLDAINRLTSSTEITYSKYLIEYCADLKILQNVSSNHFYPRPTVTSCFAKLTKKAPYNQHFFDFLKTLFISKKKLLKSNLTKLYPLDVVEQSYLYFNYSPKIRIQDLTVFQLKELYDLLTEENYEDN